MYTPRDLRNNKMIAAIIEDSGSNITSWIAILKESQYQLLLKFTTLQPVLYSSLVSCDASMTIVNWIRGLEKKSNTYEHERPRFPFRESHSYLGSESKKYNFWNTKSVVLPFLANKTLLKLFKIQEGRKCLCFDPSLYKVVTAPPSRIKICNRWAGLLSRSRLLDDRRASRNSLCFTAHYTAEQSQVVEGKIISET